MADCFCFVVVYRDTPLLWSYIVMLLYCGVHGCACSGDVHLWFVCFIGWWWLFVVLV